MEYYDLRSWIAAAESMGELRRVEGATWQEDTRQKWTHLLSGTAGAS